MTQRGDISAVDDAVQNVLGWTPSGDGCWSFTEHRMAVVEEDTFEEGYFRPDQHWKHLSIVLDKVAEVLGVKHTTEWSGMEAKISFVGTYIKVSVKGTVFKDTNVQTLRAATQFYIHELAERENNRGEEGL